MFLRLPQIFLFLFIIPLIIQAQDERAQLPAFLQKSYFEVNIGAINYPFSQLQLEDGFSMHSTQVPPVAVRLVLLGYDFNKSLSARISYMRPVVWMKYFYTVDAVHTDLLNLTVWMNYTSLNLKYKHDLSDRLSIFAEGGYSIVTRNGYTGWWGTVVKSVKFNTFEFGGGLSYRLNDKWALSLAAIYSPKNNKAKQPQTSFVSTGFSYHLRPYSKQKLEQTAQTGFVYTKQMIQFGFSGNASGYGINNMLEKAYLFWGGDVEVKQGYSINYQQNIFHSSNVFSMDWGINFSIWRSNIRNERFFTFSVFPLFRFTFLRTKPADAYLFYSVAGPTFISNRKIDGRKTGGNFTFQDNVGMGLFFGKSRNYNAEIKIGHYSNGNILQSNPGIKIPLTLNIGYSF